MGHWETGSEQPLSSEFEVLAVVGVKDNGDWNPGSPRKSPTLKYIDHICQITVKNTGCLRSP
jgi:hypothetical protein